MNPPAQREPIVFVVSGPSGSGKSTLVPKLLELPNMLASVSCTTRPRRTAENPGKCYDFVSEDEFDRMVRAGEFLEYASVFGKYRYGTPRKWLDIARDQGKDLVLEIDVQGAAQIRRAVPAAVSIFIVPPSSEELERRIRGRGQDPPEEIARRLQRSLDEMKRFMDYDFTVVNDNLDRAGREVQAIGIASRCKSSNAKGHVEEILKSFGGK